MIRSISFFLLAGAVVLLATGCATRDQEHRLVISVPEQRMALLDKGKAVALYPVSTSKFGLGDRPGTWGTPLGRLEVAAKIGAGAPSGAVFKNRRFTGEVLAPDAPGRDPIVTRIIWLRGREAQNARSFNRFIYIHGTPEERNIGRPSSYGCIRMRSKDVIEVFNIVGPGAEVNIINKPLRTSVVNLTPDGQKIAVMSSPWGRPPETSASN